MSIRLRSFRVRIAVMSTLISAAVLLAFTLWMWGSVVRMNQWRIDETIRELGHRHLSIRQAPEHWADVSESLEFVLGDIEDDPFILLVKGRDGEILHRSENWPPELSAESIAGPEVEFPEPFYGPPRGRGMGPPPPPEPGAPPPEHFPGRGRRGMGPPPIRLPVTSNGPLYTARVGGNEWRIGEMSNPDVTLALGINRSRAYAEMNWLRGALTLALPAALLLIALGGWWLAQRALRPVRALTQTAEGITAQGLDRRIAVTDEDAEFERLIRVFNKMLDRLETSFQQAVRFSADAAHELKTPLTILQGELEQAVQHAPAGSEQQQTLGRLLEEVQRLKGITRKLLLLSQVDSGQLRSHLEPVNLSEVVEAVAEDVEILGARQKLQKRIVGDLWVMADPDLLRQVVQNLANNALKYNVPGGTVALDLRQDGSGVRLTVGNSGPGIPSDDRDRIFERFYRADKSRNRRVDGVGLGLSLAREIARAHGGDLVLEETRDGWTAFALRLPLGSAKERSAVSNQQSAKSKNPSSAPG